MYVPAGQHTIEMRFDPTSLHVTEGIAYGALALLVIGIIVAVLIAKKEVCKGIRTNIISFPHKHPTHSAIHTLIRNASSAYVRSVIPSCLFCHSLYVCSVNPYILMKTTAVKHILHSRGTSSSRLWKRRTTAVRT